MQNNNKLWLLAPKLSNQCKKLSITVMSAIYKFLEVPFGKAEKLNLDKIIQKNAYTNVKPCILQWPFPSQPFGFDPERRLANMLTLMCRQGARGCYLFKTIDDFTFVQQIRWIYLICLIRLNCVSLGRHEQKGFPVKMEARTLWRLTSLILKCIYPMHYNCRILWTMSLF